LSSVVGFCGVLAGMVVALWSRVASCVLDMGVSVVGCEAVRMAYLRELVVAAVAV
jgi:hypothetical protein